MSKETVKGKKALHSDIVNYVGESFNIPHNSTSKIISTYIALQGNILLSGTSIYFGDFATIEVTTPYQDEEYSYSTALLGTIISKELNIPVNMTIQVIRKYLATVKSCSIVGYSTGVQSLFRILPSEFNEDGTRASNVNSYVPQYLLSELKDRGIVARVSVKNLRDSLKFSNLKLEEENFINSITETNSSDDLDEEFNMKLFSEEELNKILNIGYSTA